MYLVIGFINPAIEEEDKDEETKVESNSYGSDIEKKSKAIDAKKAIEELQANDEMLINIKEQDDDFRLLTPQELQEEAQEPPYLPGLDNRSHILVLSSVSNSIQFPFVNPLTDLKHTRSSSEDCHGNLDIVPLGVHIRENAEPNSGPVVVAKKVSTEKFHKKPRALKPTSL
ncbi:hypothetical protein AgCh_017480 [Apium graveolens]